MEPERPPVAPRSRPRQQPRHNGKLHAVSPCEFVFVLHFTRRCLDRSRLPVLASRPTRRPAEPRGRCNGSFLEHVAAFPIARQASSFAQRFERDTTFAPVAARARTSALGRSSAQSARATSTEAKRLPSKRGGSGSWIRFRAPSPSQREIEAGLRPFSRRAETGRAAKCESPTAPPGRGRPEAVASAQSICSSGKTSIRIDYEHVASRWRGTDRGGEALCASPGTRWRIAMPPGCTSRAGRRRVHGFRLRTRSSSRARP